MFVYRFDVLKKLKERGYNATRLKKEFNLGSSAIDKLRCGDIVGINVLDKLCFLLDMQPGSIIRYIPDEDEDGTLTQ